MPPSIHVAIRDQAGRPAALGTVVVFGGAGGLVRDSTRGDSLTIRGGGFNTTYAVLVSKPYYTAVTFNNVSVQGAFDRCGKPENLAPPVTLDATLVILPDAPPVRSLYVMSATGSNLLDRGGRDSLKIEPWLDANTTVSHAIVWRLTGDTASVSFNPATGVASFRCRSTLGIVNVVALSAADTNVTASMTLRVQEHPASSDDPPCS
ncbi:MAG: hypothetical protein ACREN6_15375 [Gemmatimonadaceae bacterium]